MTHYGELLGVYEPAKDQVYSMFDTYFNHPIMTKIKDVDHTSMYMSKTYCLLSNECRYIVAFVLRDPLVSGTKQPLEVLPWVSIQTRTLGDHHELPPHDYQADASTHLKQPITRVSFNGKLSTYSCDGLPLTVSLLHTKPNDKFEYQDRGMLVSALETYQTIVTLEE